MYLFLQEMYRESFGSNMFVWGSAYVSFMVLRVVSDITDSVLLAATAINHRLLPNHFSHFYNR